MNRTDDGHVHDDIDYHCHHDVLIFIDCCACFKALCSNCAGELNEPECLVLQVSLYHCCFHFHDIADTSALCRSVRKRR